MKVRTGTFTRALVAAVAIGALAGPGPAQGAPELRLLKDINPGEAHSDPFGAGVVGGRALFPADDGAHGRELWSTDGTTAGTVMLTELNPGFTGSNAYALGTVGGKYLFAASSPGTGLEPWISDGSAAGTRLLADLNEGAANSSPGYCGFVGGRYVFFANNTSTGKRAVYMTDGTTVEVKYVEPRPGCGLYKDRLYFDADDGAKGNEPWSTDGTAAGTSMLKDVAPNAAPSYPRHFALAGEGAGQRLVFGADGTGGTKDQLWATDGTSVGTVMIKDYGEGSTGQAEPAGMTTLGNRAYFRATDSAGSELWATDGTTNGTVRLADLNPGPASSSPYFKGRAPDGALLMQAEGQGIGVELFRTDGTEAGTALLKDLQPGPGSSNPGIFGEFVTFAGRTYFSARTDATGSELFETDGSPAGTRLAADVNRGSGDSGAGAWVVVADKLLVTADGAGTGREPYVLGEFGLLQPPTDPAVAPPVVSPPATDTTPPALVLAARRKARVGKRLRVGIAAAGEPREIRGSAVLRFGKKRVRLPGTRSAVAAGERASVAFALSRKVRARVARALRAGTRVRAHVTVTAADAAGNAATAARTIRLVRA